MRVIRNLREEGGAPCLLSVACTTCVSGLLAAVTSSEKVNTVLL